MSPSDYVEALARIETGNPTEPLLPALRRGWSRVNAIYMAAALKRLPAPEPVWQDQTPFADENLRGLWAERTRLFGEMNRRSNQFHDCKSDEDRAANSREIRRIWGLILAVKERIEHYEAHGELPEEPSEERFPLPDEPVALMKKLNSIRAQISQGQRRLDDLGALPDGHPEREKIADVEGRLAELKLYRGHAENAVKRASVHAG